MTQLLYRFRPVLLIALGVGGGLLVVLLFRLGGALTDLPAAEKTAVAEKSNIVDHGRPVTPSAAHFASPAAETPATGVTILRGQLTRNEFLGEVLMRAGLAPVETEAAIRALKGIFDPRKARPGDQYNLTVSSAGKLLEWEYRTSLVDIYRVTGAAAGYQGVKIPLQVERVVQSITGKIEATLWEAMESTGEDHRLTMELADVFAWDIDFYNDTRQGDTFLVVFEKDVYQGQAVSYGRILAARYNGGLVGKKELYYYDKGPQKGYYDAGGTCAKQAFLRSPLKFTRVSSGFGKRINPISRKPQFHGGIDYAAPIGTPVQAVADGVVVQSGLRGGAGRMVAIKHTGGYQSTYMHLSRLNVHLGQHVTQKTVIGAVGSSGLSTGPHLDFRLLHNGKYLNPLKRVAPRTQPLPPAELPSFRLAIAPLQAVLNGDAMLALANPLLAAQRSAVQAVLQ